MAKDLIGHYGPDSKPGGNRSSCGGVEEFKPLKYKPPVGPTNQMRSRPGLGGTNHGNAGTQGKR